GLPLGDAIRPGAERAAVVILRAIDVASLQDVTGKRAANELNVVGRVDLLVVNDGGQRIGRVDRADAVESIRALGVVVRTVDRVDGELHIVRREWHIVVPPDAAAQLPGDIHSAVGTKPDAAVVERRHALGQERNDVHLFVSGGQPFDYARLDVL